MNTNSFMLDILKKTCLVPSLTMIDSYNNNDDYKIRLKGLIGRANLDQHFSKDKERRRLHLSASSHHYNYLNSHHSYYHSRSIK